MIANYHLIFRACPSNFILLMPDTPQFTIVEVTDYHCTLLGRKREDLIGKGLFECYPENPDINWDKKSTQKLAASFAFVVEQKTHHGMLIRYDVLNDRGEAYEARYWNIDNYPIFDKQGSLEYVLHTSVDVTPLQMLGMLPGK